jgi:hypothetical protein
MEMVVFGYQIVPGRDEPLAFAASLEECQREALSEREELRRNDPDLEPLGAMALYRLTLPWPDIDGLLAVLNEKTSLLDTIVTDRKLVGIVADRIHRLLSEADDYHVSQCGIACSFARRPS